MGVKKSLSVRVQERAQRVLPAARNRAQVVALRKEIEQAITDGCTLAMIWNTLSS
ncbi:MAG: TraK family protein [Nitrospira sp.]